ncbi:beta strand repeat-containing protein [Marinimicrobium alkaliphilum]|uniref:beta strand repeat-containing protein n=1 Tax=Marinimicrobium alkaliphilum TaxID=2202654 RepID=UPI001E372793|nr:Ig-like domain-containing protein [Marinimicrobium alkaliphilum]
MTSVAVPANGTYIAGQNLSFTVNTSENVTVNTGTGTPRIALTIGATTRYATYLSGSGTSAVVFRYTVQAGDHDNDGIALAATLDPDGGTLRDSAGNDLNTTLNSVGSTTNVLVDAVAPTVSSVSVPSNGTYSTGQHLDFTVNTSKNVTVNTGGGTSRIALTIGATTRYATYLSGSGTSAVVFRYTVQAGDSDSDGIALAAALDPDGGTIRDNAGNDLNTALNAIGDTSGVLVDTALPTITAGNINISGATGNNGAYRIGDTVTATWNNTAGGDNNLAASDVSVDFSEFGGGGAVMATNDNDTWTATYDIVAGSIDATNRNVSVSATNANGTTTVADTTNATVDNIAPTVTDANISISGASGTGGAYIIGDTVTATWNNTAGGDNNSDTSSVTVDFSEFGGGSAIAATEDAGTWTASFELVTDTVDASDRNVSITATDDAGNSNTTADITNATVDTIAPTVSVANITLSGATGTNGAFIIGDTVTATWDDSASGDNNPDTDSVTVDFSEFGGSAIAATNNAGVWTATFDLSASAIDAADRNISVSATDNAGNQTATAGDHNVPVNTIAPQVSAGNIALNGASGTGGIFIAGDTLTVTWDNTAAGDNNSQPVASVTVDVSAFGGGSAVAASASGDEWSASFALDAGLEADNLNASVTAVTEAGNPTTTASTSNVSVDTQVPDAPGVSFDQSPISSVNADNISLTLSAAETDTTANYSISSDGGGTPVTGSATITNANQTLSGIDASDLDDGTLTVSLTLTDAAGNVSDAATATVTKDATPAEVQSLGLTDGDYAEGETIHLTVELNKDVTVTGTDATLAIDVGPETRSAEFVSEVDGLLSFRYTVQDGDNTDANGVTVLASGITLNTTTIEDSASNAADLNFAQQSFANVQVDTIAPDEPVVTAPAEALSVNTDTFEIAGTLSEDEVTVRLYADTNQDGLPDDPSDPLESAVVASSQWSIEHTLLRNTDNHLVVVAQDAAGNRSAPVAVPVITHDNVAPDAPESLALDPDSDSGASDSDGITNHTELLISGTAEAGSTVILNSNLDDEVGSTTANNEGDWEITTDSLTDGEHQLTATTTDAAGNISDVSSALSVTVDTEAPAQPSAPLLETSSDSGISNSDGITNDATPLITGTAEAESRIELVSNLEGAIGDVYVDGAGNWSITSDLLSDGNHQLTVTATDLAGNVSDTSEPLAINLDTQAPVITGSAADNAEPTDTEVNFVVTFSEPVHNLAIADFALGTTGTATGNVDTLTSSGGTSVTVSVSNVGGEGSLRLDYTGTGAIDTAGNALLLFTGGTAHAVDTVAPDTPEVSFTQDPVNADNHSSISLNLTDAELDSTADYTLTTDGGTGSVSGSATITDADQTLSGIDVSGLADGTLTVSLTLTDAAGNVSDAATATATKDATPALVQSVSITDGDYAEGETIHLTVELNKDVTVTGTDATLAIDIGPDTRNAEFVSEVDGLLNFRYTVQDGDNTDANGVTVLASGITLNTTTIEDSAGNAADLSFAQQSFDSVQVDTIAPDEPVVSAPAEALSVSTDNFEIAGSLGEDDITVRLYADNNQDGTPDDPSDPLESAVVTSGQWSIDHTLIQNSDNHLVVIAQDAAGNRSAPVAVPVITHDNIAPAAPENLALDPSTDSGASDSDGITNITELLISGTAEANSTVILTSDLDGEVGSATVDSDGDWEITTDTLNDGEHELTAIATDAAANSSDASSMLTVTVDTQAPTIGAIANQHISLIHGSNPISFTLTDDVTDADTIDLELTSSDADVLPETRIDLGGSGEDRSMLLLGEAPGVTEITLTATDTAGNSESLSFEVLVNTPPSIGGDPADSVDTHQSYRFEPSATDPNGGTLMFSISNTPPWAEFDSTTGALSGTPTDVGSFSNIVITVTDGLDSATLAPFAIEVQQGNRKPEISGDPPTEVMVGEVYHFAPSASDPDGDTLSFSASGLPGWLSLNRDTGELTGTPDEADKGASATVTLSVSDGELSDSLPGFTVTVIAFEDIEPPQLTVPADRVIDARELRPRITLAQLLGLPADAGGEPLADALAVLTTDNVDGDGCCSPMAEGFESGSQRLRPGRHDIVWRAVDSAGNEAEVIQTLYLRPMVSLSRDQVTLPGNQVSVRAILNGPSPFYPFEVPYTLDSDTTASAEDHDLSDGTLVFEQGETEKTLTVTLSDSANLNNRELVIRLDDRDDTRLNESYSGEAPALHHLNTSARHRHVIRILEGNVPPRVALQLTQGGRSAALVAPDAGPVTVAATVVDPNTDDSHSFDWSNTDNSLTASANGVTAEQLVFDPSDLSPGRYSVEVWVTDSGGESGRARLPVRVVATLPELDPEQDSNDNGIDDATEGLGDRNNNGIPDYLDATPSANVLPHQIAQRESFLLECDPGVRCRIGSRALMGDSGGVLLVDDDFDRQSDLPTDDGFEPIGGVFDFELHDLLEPGQSVRVVVPQRAPIVPDAVYRKLVNGQWQDFVEDEGNALHSAGGEEGQCPPPGDDTWEPGLAEGHWCVQLTLEDGGPNDADGERDGSISDPGAVSRRIDNQDEEEPPEQEPPEEENPEEEATEPVEQVRISSAGRSSGHSSLGLWLLVLVGGLRPTLTALKARARRNAKRDDRNNGERT